MIATLAARGLRHCGICIGIVILTITANVNAAIFGADTRRPLDELNSLQLQKMAMGRVFCRHPDTGIKMMGTAAIIEHEGTPEGHETILTAAHVLIDVESGRPLNGCRFRPEGQLFGGVKVAPHRHGSFDGRPQTNADDWALATVALPRVDTVRLKRAIAGVRIEQLALLAYQKSRPGLWVSSNCFARPATSEEALFEHSVYLSDCDASPGSSGAPLLVKQQGEWRWIGIYRGHLYNRLEHDQVPTHQPEFSGKGAMNIIVRPPLPMP